MIITVRGLNDGMKDAAAITALLASMTAIVKSKKTVAMQFTGMEAPSILDYLSGKQIQENEISQAFKLYTDDGIDGLLIRAETAELSREHFDETVTALLDKEHLLDIIKITNKRDFYETFTKEKILNIIEGAKQLYDYIYVLLPEKSDIIEIMTDPDNVLSDENIICVPQGPQVDLGRDVPLNLTILAYDFEAASKYDVKSMAKYYGVRRVYTLPPDFLYRDAVYSRTLLDFVIRNKKDMREDYNYDFTHSVMQLLGKYVAGGSGDDDDDESVEDAPVKERLDTTEERELKELPDEAIQEITVKKGLFGKKKHLTADI